MTAKESKAVAFIMDPGAGSGMDRLIHASSRPFYEMSVHERGGSFTPLVPESALHAAESLLAEAESRIVVLQSRLDAVVGLVGELVTLAKAHEIKADRADTHPDTSNWHAGFDEGVTECVDRIRAALGGATTGEGGE